MFRKFITSNLKIILLWIIGLEWAKILCHQDGCSYESDVDYLGQDLNALPEYLDSADLCCKACMFNENCQIWTYIPNTKACWLKSPSGSIRITSFGSRQIFLNTKIYIVLKSI